MRGDFSRFSPDSGKYSGVLMQQGRVLLDSDWNTATGESIWAHRAFAADVLGPHGGPSGRLGFTPALAERDGQLELELSPGAYYVDGIRCELDVSLLPPGRDALPWTEQPYPVALESEVLPDDPYLVYLDVWERLVTVLEDASIAEPALAGSDTTARRQVIWQVRIMPYCAGDGGPTSDTFPLEDWRQSVRGAPPRMRATTSLSGAANGGYGGSGNHLYRIEIVSLGAGGSRPRFAWSRDNGSVAARWTATEGSRLHVADTDDSHNEFSSGDWIELAWESMEFARAPATWVQVVAVDAHVVTVDLGTASGPVEADPASRAHATVRRWDQRDTSATHLVNGAVEVPWKTNDWIPLEDGIWIDFDPGDTDQPYWVGDYWTFPARTATGDIDWPRDVDGQPVFLAPQGPVHHYAPLGFVADGSVVPLQKAFRPLATSF